MKPNQTSRRCFLSMLHAAEVLNSRSQVNKLGSTCLIRASLLDVRDVFLFWAWCLVGHLTLCRVGQQSPQDALAVPWGQRVERFLSNCKATAPTLTHQQPPPAQVLSRVPKVSLFFLGVAVSPPLGRSTSGSKREGRLRSPDVWGSPGSHRAHPLFPRDRE